MAEAQNCPKLNWISIIRRDQFDNVEWSNFPIENDA